MRSTSRQALGLVSAGLLGLLLCPSVARGQVVHVVRQGAPRLEVTPGSTVTAVFQIANRGRSAATIQGRATLPPQWRAITPELPIRLAPKTGDIRLLSLAIPRDATAGTYVIRYSAFAESAPGQPASDSILLAVQERRELRLEPLGAPPFVVAGEPYVSNFLLQNLGNAVAEVRLEVRSDEGLPARTDSSPFRLTPGQSRSVAVNVASPSGLRHTLEHRLELRASAGGAAGHSALAISLVTIVPRATSTPSQIHRLPIEIRLRASAPRGIETPYQVSGGGPLTPGSSSRLDFLVRGGQSGGGRLSGERDEYYASLQTPHFGVRGGDQVYALSPLSEVGRYAFGAEGRLEAAGIRVGGLWVRNRQPGPRHEQRGAYLKVRPVGGFQLALHGLDQMTGDSGRLWTARGVFPLRYVTVDLEYGAGVGPRSGAIARSMHLYGGLPWVSYELESTRGDTGFVGSARGISREYGSLSLQPGGAVQVMGSLSRQAHWIRGPGSAGSRRQESRLGYGRLSYGRALALEYRRSAVDNSHPPLHLTSRLGQSARLRLNLRPGGLWLLPSAELGEVQDQVTGTRQRFHRIGVQGILSGRGQGTLSAAVEHFTGDVTSPAAHPVISGSLFFSTQLLHGSRLRASLYGIRQLGPSAQLQGGVDATLEQQLPLGHRLALRVRTSGLLSDRTAGETLASLDYVIPLGVPIGRSGEGARVSGRVLDAETGKGVTDVLVQVGGRTVITDREGRWAVGGLAPASYHVELDRASLGADRLALGDMPRPVRAEQGKTVSTVFRVVRGARVTGRVRLSSPRVPQADGAATKVGLVEADAMPNLLVELAGEGTVIRRVTDSKGGFEFTDLPPGRWVLSADASALPAHHRLERDSIALVLQPAAVADIDLKVIAKVRPVQFVAAAEIAAGPPAAAERRVPAEWVPGPGKADGPRSDTASYQRYRVTARDRHLRDVARKLLGNPCAWSRLWHANRAEVPDPARLRIGQILRIPAAETRQARTAGCGEKEKYLK